MLLQAFYMKGNHNRILNNLIQLVFHGDPIRWGRKSFQLQYHR